MLQLCIGVVVVAMVMAVSVVPQCQAAGHSDHNHDAVVAPVFEELEVVPDVLDVAPQRELIITYPNAVSVHFGDELKPAQVKDIPAVHWDADPTAFYTLIMTDPDAPSRANPVSREWQHWTVANIPGANVTAGNTLAEYVGSGPPKDTGKHRYVFVVYRQQTAHDFGEPLLKRTNGNRGRFSTRAFEQKHGLGAPVAGNVFLAEYDDSVPTLHKQFTE